MKAGEKWYVYYLILTLKCGTYFLLEENTVYFLYLKVLFLYLKVVYVEDFIECFLSFSPDLSNVESKEYPVCILTYKLDL